MNTIFRVTLAGSAVALLLLVAPSAADAQYPVAVTSYYAPAPSVAYLPVRRALFGRVVVAPRVVAYPPVAVVAPPTTCCAPTPAVTYYAPAPAVVVPPVVTYRPRILPVPTYWRP